MIISWGRPGGWEARARRFPNALLVFLMPSPIGAAGDENHILGGAFTKDQLSSAYFTMPHNLNMFNVKLPFSQINQNCNY